MGILDEAIRDHLELKRQRGANRDELKRLEDEAFGPPSRPGEPDFPQAEPSRPQQVEVAAGAEPPTTVIEAEERAGPEPAPQAEREPTLNGSVEPGAEEHPVLGDEAVSPATPFDHTLEDDLDLGDIDLGGPADTAVSPPPPPGEPAAPESPVEEPPPSAAGPAPAPPAEPAAAPAPAPAPPEDQPEPPIESLDTVEHPFEPGLSEEELESEELPPDEPPSEELERPAEESPTGEPTASEEGEAESGEEDVLADTPDFLRDAPEDDELWFEQGEPKDFDFD